MRLSLISQLSCFRSERVQCRLFGPHYDTIRYDTIGEFNVVDSKAECVQLNLAHVARKKI